MNLQLEREFYGGQIMEHTWRLAPKKKTKLGQKKKPFLGKTFQKPF
jgi:hypothetical protein